MSGFRTTAGRAVRARTATASSSRAHILVADGNPASRRVREQQLRAAGFRVSLASTGFEAIVKASCYVPDFILIDGALGDIDPTDAGRLLTTCPVTSHIPIVLLSAGRRVPQRVLSHLRRRVTF